MKSVGFVSLAYSPPPAPSRVVSSPRQNTGGFTQNADRVENLGVRKSKPRGQVGGKVGDNVSVTPQPLPEEGELVEEQVPANWDVTVDASWRNKLFFRGLDVLDRVSPDSAPNGLVQTRASWGYRRGDNYLSAGIMYIEALDSQLPNGNAHDFNGAPAGGGRRSNPSLASWRSLECPRERYSETDLFLTFSRMLVPETIEGSIGVTHYRFSDGAFWDSGQGPADSTTESTMGISYLKWERKSDSMAWSVIPTFTWVHDFDAFDGDFLELSTQGNIYFPRWKLAFSPFAKLGYDLEYNGDNNGWNNLELGMGVSHSLHPTSGSMS
ncbi:MAG: hypothetical protein R3F11_14910 [Verrucomicrobiales bacterium]